MIETIKGARLGQQIPPAPPPRAQGSTGFGTLLQEKLEQTQSQGVAFSKHAGNGLRSGALR